MDDKKKVVLTNLCNYEITVSIPELHFTRKFPRKGAKISVDKDLFIEMANDPGLIYMLETGMLYLDDMETKIDLGLEPEGASEPQNIKMLTDKDYERYLTRMPVSELKSTIDTMQVEQVKSLVDYAIAHEITDISRCDILKKVTGTDVIRAVQLNRAAKEPLSDEE